MKWVSVAAIVWATVLAELLQGLERKHQAVSIENYVAAAW